MDNTPVTTPEWNTTYAERVGKLQEEVREENARKVFQANKKEIVLSDPEIDMARILCSLMNDDLFKKYLEYEAIEIGRRLTESFDEPADASLKLMSFGEKMAFNKGRYYQMEHFRRIRRNLISRYLEKSKLEKEKSI